MSFGTGILSEFMSISLRALGLATLAWFVLRVGRVRSPAAQHAVWMMVVTGMILLTLHPVLPPIHARMLPADMNERPDFGAGERTAVRAGVWKQATPLGTTARPAPVKPAAPQPRISWAEIAVIAYLMVALGFFAQLAGAYWITLRLTRRSKPVGQMDSVTVCESDCVAIPLTVGWLRPKILLPESWREWDQDTLNTALTHEREHVRRGDWIASVLSALNRCVFWFHPVAWWVERRLTILAEESCDDATLCALGDREQYASTLLNMAREVQLKRHRLDLAAMAMARPKQIKQRIERVLDDTREIGRAFSRRRWCALLALASPVIYIAAAFQPLRMLVQSPALLTVREPGRPIVTANPSRPFNNSEDNVLRMLASATPNEMSAVERAAEFYTTVIANGLAQTGTSLSSAEDLSRAQATLEKSTDGWVLQRTASMLIASGLRIGAPGPTRIEWTRFPGLSKAVAYGVRLMARAQEYGEGGGGTGIAPEVRTPANPAYTCEASPDIQDFYFSRVKSSQGLRVELLKSALVANPEDVFLNRWLALTPYIDLREEFRQKLAQHPNDPRYLYYYAQAMMTYSWDPAKAMPYLKKSVAIAPDFPWNYLLLAHIHSIGNWADQSQLVQNMRAIADLCPYNVDYRQLPRVHDPSALRDLAARYRRAIDAGNTSGIADYYPSLWSVELRLIPSSQYLIYARQVAADVARLKLIDRADANALLDGEALIAALGQ